MPVVQDTVPVLLNCSQMVPLLIVVSTVVEPWITESAGKSALQGALVVTLCSLCMGVSYLENCPVKLTSPLMVWSLGNEIAPRRLLFVINRLPLISGRSGKLRLLSKELPVMETSTTKIRLGAEKLRKLL